LVVSEFERSAAVSRRPAAARPKVERWGMLCTRPAMRSRCGWSRTTPPRSGAGCGCARCPVAPDAGL